MGKIIAIANQKGGVGKTTTAINLSSSLSRLGKKVLLGDLDPQGNAGRGLGLDITLLPLTILDVLEGKAPIKKAIMPTLVSSLSIIPSNLRLSSLEAHLLQKGSDNPYSLLSTELEKVRNDYDYILLDCPPSLGLLSLNGLAASNSVLIPVQCEFFALEAVASILSTIVSVQKKWNPSLEIEGFLLTMHDAKTTLSNEVSNEIRRLFQTKTFLTNIPRNASIAEAQARQMPVDVFRPTSLGAIAYMSLAREVIDHEGNQ